MRYIFMFRASHKAYSVGMSHKFLRQSWKLYSTQAETLVKPARIINQPSGLEFGISQRAATRLANIYREARDVLQISVESGGCHGFQYNMKLVPENNVEEPESLELEKEKETTHDLKTSEDIDDFDDEFNDNRNVVFILPEGQGKVVIDENSLKILNKTMLTYSTELIGSTFKISGGNMKSSCGCGSSFDVAVEK